MKELWNYEIQHLTCNVEVVGSSPITDPRCFLEQETLPLSLSTLQLHYNTVVGVHGENVL